MLRKLYNLSLIFDFSLKSTDAVFIKKAFLYEIYVLKIESIELFMKPYKVLGK